MLKRMLRRSKRNIATKLTPIYVLRLTLAVPDSLAANLLSTAAARGAPRHDQRSFIIYQFCERSEECQVSEEARKRSVRRSTRYREDSDMAHGIGVKSTGDVLRD